VKASSGLLFVIEASRLDPLAHSFPDSISAKVLKARVRFLPCRAESGVNSPIEDAKVLPGQFIISKESHFLASLLQSAYVVGFQERKNVEGSFYGKCTELVISGVQVLSCFIRRNFGHRIRRFGLLRQGPRGKSLQSRAASLGLHLLHKLLHS